jgi:tRNA1(Val) A37 N6-methylase TrmN6
MPEIYVLDKKLRLLQPEQGFRTSLDTIMLAAACPAKNGDHLLDAGCGVGAAGFCVAQRLDSLKLTGVDIDAEFIDMATKNAEINNFSEERTAFHCADIDQFRRQDTPIFDHIISNPPYLNAGEYLNSPHEKKAIAIGHEGSGFTLEGWIRALHRLVKPKGSVTIIHRADYTDQIIKAFGHRFGAVEIIPLWPKQGRQAKRVIIRALKDRKDPCKILPGILLHNDNETYSDIAEDSLRGRAIIA